MNESNVAAFAERQEEDPDGRTHLTAAAFQNAFSESAALRGLLLRYAQCYLSQVSQSSACNRGHSIEKRCARWLLMTHDRVGADEFPLTHEFLSYMLGVRRAGVTVAAGMLQKAGLIEYKHGRIKMVDREGLEALPMCDSLLFANIRQPS